MRRRTLVGSLSLATSVALVGMLGLPVALATSTPDASGAVAAAAAGAPAFTKSVTATRTHLVGGVDLPVESRKITLSVSQTSGLRDRQGLDVTWSGARPTGGIVSDPHSGAAIDEEYPMVLLQCRGIDSTGVAASKRVSPQTCWTGTPVERFIASYSPLFPAWRVDRYAAPAERTHNPGVPSPRPTFCFSPPPVEHWLPFLSSNGTIYHGGPRGCDGIAPEATDLDATTGLPSNTTYAATRLDGTGSARFDVRDDINNGSLGCSSIQPCTLVAVPIMGVSCDVTAASLPIVDRPTGTDAVDASRECTKAGSFLPGQLASPTGGGNDLAVSGSLWWSASNWRNRISVPLSMSPLASACSLQAGAPSADIYGSELLVQATTQWAPKFCQDPKAVTIKHVQVGEPQARNLLLTGSVDAAFTTVRQAGGYPRPVVHAPVAVTGFSVSYTIDGANGDPYRSLKLTPRLLAKLLTASYPALSIIQADYSSLKSNPLNMSVDPEFIALNPGLTQGVAATYSASSLYALSSDSDVLYALTSYINADPEARAWLDGTPDPWGMVVNANYKKIELPVQSWPLLDTYEPKSYYRPGINDCLFDAPVPFLPLVAAPTSRLATISLAMQYAIAPSQVVCVQPFAPSYVGQKLNAIGRQTAGYRFLLGLSSLGDAKRFGLDQAALQTHVTSGAESKFTDATGRTFVAPSDASLRAAAVTIAPTSNPVDWQLSYDALRTDTKLAGAYPGTMLIFADVATKGLSPQSARGLSSFLSLVAGSGQTPGVGVGNLAPGFLPMTRANGLGAMADYTARAAAAVAAQNGVVPPLVPVTPTASPLPRPTPTTPAVVATTGNGSPTTAATPTASPSASASPSPSTSSSVIADAPAALKTRGIDPGLTGLAIPALLGIVVVVSILTVVTMLFSREST